MMKMLRIRHPPVCEIWRSRPPEWILVEFGEKDTDAVKHAVHRKVEHLLICRQYLYMYTPV